MPLSTFAFTPAQGFRDSSFAPTDPPSEAALRDTMQDIPDQLRDALNGVITTLNSTTDGSSGADNIGMTPISGLTATNPQEALEELALKSPINVADNSITDLKLAPDVKVGSLATLFTSIKTSVVGSINELFNIKANLNNPTFTSNINLTTINTKTPSYSVVPTETIVNSGFNSGWSGEIRYRINQEGLITLVLVVEKTTDLLTTSETIITIPKIATTHPFGLGVAFSLWTPGFATRVQGAEVEIKVDGSGNIKVASIGSVTSTAKAINGSVLSYY